MASFAHLAHVLERAADIMLGDHDLDPGEALRRALWGERPVNSTDPEMAVWLVTARVVELQYGETVGNYLANTPIAYIPHWQARSAARHMACLFQQFGSGRVEDHDLDKVARLMWEHARDVESARCP
ncbi:hypothetical protein [Nonomuraea sp. NPDC049141]|uniref:hypothetical protein n=1 Tax=Nonomuraea sp. NPDC049141 TaxID=3155500 RepID=UPI0033F15D15